MKRKRDSARPRDAFNDLGLLIVGGLITSLWGLTATCLTAAALFALDLAVIGIRHLRDAHRQVDQIFRDELNPKDPK